MASTRSRDRAELQRLLAQARAGELHGRRLYLYRLDRLTRTGIADTLQTLDDLRGHGVEVVSVADGFDLSGPHAALVVPVTTQKRSSSGDEQSEREASHRRWRPWIELLKRSFAIDLACSKCGGPMKLKALLTSPQSSSRLLTKLGEPTEAPQRAPPREPPYFATLGERRRQPNAPPPQTDLFDEPA